jgi:transcriptional regulator of met regulon
MDALALRALARSAALRAGRPGVECLKITVRIRLRRLETVTEDDNMRGRRSVRLRHAAKVVLYRQEYFHEHFRHHHVQDFRHEAG